METVEHIHCISSGFVESLVYFYIHFDSDDYI